MQTTPESLEEFNRMLRKQDEDARTDSYFKHLNDAMRSTIVDFQQGRATAEDVQRFLPGHSEWDVHQQYGNTDQGLLLTPNIDFPSFEQLEKVQPPSENIHEFGPGGRYFETDELRAKDGGSVDTKLAKEMANNQFDQLFVESGQKYGVDPAILKAIASVESSFRPNVRGPRTRYGQAQGMMQFIPATAKAYGLDDPLDPAKSIDAAARLMRDNMRMFKGDVGKALEAYNGGPRLVGKSKQTAEYRDKVMQRSQYANLGAPPTQVAQKPAPRTPPRAQPPSPPARVGGERVGLSALSTLPMNYQAALALQYITDTDPEGNPEEQAEKALRDLEQNAQVEEERQGPTLAQALASQQEALPSPFEAFQRKKPEKRQRALPSMAAVMGFDKGGEARSDDYEDLATQMTFGTLPKDAKDSKAVKEGLKKSAQDIRRGIQYFPADLIGAPVDIINMGLTPFGLGSDKPFMGSDYLIDKGVKAGIYEKPSGSGVETITRMAGLPTTALRSAMSAMQKGEEALGKGIDLVRGNFPETAPSGAVGSKPPGASFSFMPTMETPFVGRIDKHVANLPYPVQKQAFINSLKGKFKGYEVDRVEEALEGLPADKKLNSSDILNALQSNQFYVPSNYKVEIIPRGTIPTSEMYTDFDISFRPAGIKHSFGSASVGELPLGVIHLKHDRPNVATLEDNLRKVDFTWAYPGYKGMPAGYEFRTPLNFPEDALEIPTVKQKPLLSTPVTGPGRYEEAFQAFMDYRKNLEKVKGVTQNQLEQLDKAIKNYSWKSKDAFTFASAVNVLREPRYIELNDNRFVGVRISDQLDERGKKAAQEYMEKFPGGDERKALRYAYKEAQMEALRKLEGRNFDIERFIDIPNLKDGIKNLDAANFNWSTTANPLTDLQIYRKFEDVAKRLETPEYSNVNFSTLTTNPNVRWEEKLENLFNTDPDQFFKVTNIAGRMADVYRATLLSSHPDVAVSKASNVSSLNKPTINAIRDQLIDMGYPRAFSLDNIFPAEELDLVIKKIKQGVQKDFAQTRPLDFVKLWSHDQLRPPVDAISFSRFFPVKDENAFSPRTGIHITELQSDRRKLAEVLGTPKESPTTDVPKIQTLKEKLDKATKNLDDFEVSNDANFTWGSSGRYFKDPDLQSQWGRLKERKVGAEKLLKAVESRASKVGTDTPRSPGYTLPVYGVQESFPGMMSRGEDLQNLMIKAAIDGAIRQNASFVTFPGKESLQAQLYEHIEKNMKSVVKELGAPFRIEEVTLRTFDIKNPNDRGTLVRKPAIVWDSTNEAKKTIGKGIPFAKGGLVSMKSIHDWV